MAIKINDIPPEGLIVELDERIELFEDGTSAPVTAMMTIRPGAGDSFHVSGRANATTELECSRCLKRFPFMVQDAVMDFDLLREGSVKAGAEHELGRAELDTEFYRGDEIEPRELVREQLLLAIPMVPVHQEDCKGLCPLCGADRNEQQCSCKPEAMPEKENPFAVLKKIIKPEKE